MRTTPVNEWTEYIRRVVDRQFAGVQSDLARAVGVSSQTVGRWISHGARPRFPVLVELARVTGRPVSELQAIAHGLDPADVKARARAAEVARRAPHDQLDTYLERLREAKASGRISAAEYKSAMQMITLAAEMQIYEKVTKKESP